MKKETNFNRPALLVVSSLLFLKPQIVHQTLKPVNVVVWTWLMQCLWVVMIMHCFPYKHNADTFVFENVKNRLPFSLKIRAASQNHQWFVFMQKIPNIHYIFLHGQNIFYNKKSFKFHFVIFNFLLYYTHWMRAGFTWFDFRSKLEYFSRRFSAEKAPIQ